MYIVTFLTVANKQLECPLPDEWIKKMYVVYTQRNNIKPEKREYLYLHPFTTWMNLEGIISELS